jgi:hypothetical protein
MAKIIAGKTRPVLLRGIEDETIVVGFDAVEVKPAFSTLKKDKVIGALIEAGELVEYTEKEKEKEKDDEDKK